MPYSNDLLATTITHPFDVLRTRIQLKPQEFQNTLHAAQLTFHQDGLRGFFLGLVPRLVRKTLSAAITWTLYEELVKILMVTKRE